MSPSSTMKYSTAETSSHGPVSRVKRIVGKFRRHSNRQSISSTSSNSSSAPGSQSSNCPFSHIGHHIHHHSQSRRSSRHASICDDAFHALDLELWSDAYEKLRNDSGSAGLVLAYESIVAHELPEPLKPGRHGNPPDLPGERDKRLELMTAIAAGGLHRELGAGSRSESGGSEARDILLSARATVASLIPVQPSAALAWAGICSVTPLLLDPLLRHDDLKQGLIHITNTIPHFMTLPRALLSNSWASQSDFQRLYPHVRQTLVDLYRRILEFEMNVVCAAASAWNMPARNVVDWHGWRAMADAVREKDKEMMADVARYCTDEVSALIQGKSHNGGEGRQSTSENGDGPARN